MVWSDLMSNLVDPYGKRWKPSGVIETYFEEICAYVRRRSNKTEKEIKQNNPCIFFDKFIINLITLRFLVLTDYHSA